MGIYKWAYFLSIIAAVFSSSVFEGNTLMMKEICRKNPNLPFCALRRNTTDFLRRRFIRSESRSKFASGPSHQQTDADKVTTFI
uniref:Secreted protein n=1 Tax=Ascaris lumbricoides TaxID=6252 RepID=A0A0M3INH6_ASCLU